MFKMLRTLIVGLCFISLTSASHAFIGSGSAGKGKIVVDAVNAFQAKNIGLSKELFLKAKASFPENYAVNYYLGIIHLNEGDKVAAVSEWREFLGKAPDGNSNKLQVYKDLTLLQKAIAKEHAIAVTGEEQTLALPLYDDTVAVTYFQNLGSGSLDPLQKGMTQMLITDMSQVQGLKLVERVRLQAIIDELRLAQSGLVNQKGQASIGKFLGAGKMVSGNYADLRGVDINVTSSLIKTSTGNELGSSASKGKLLEFWQVEKNLVKGILEDMGIQGSAIPSSAKKVHTKNFEAFKHFSRGLDYSDKGEYDKARDELQEAIKLDPSFELARMTLIAMPLAMMSTASIAASAVTVAPAATAAATAVTTVAVSTAAASTTSAATATTGAATAATVSAGGVVAGVAAVGGAVAVASSGNGSQGATATTPRILFLNCYSQGGAMTATVDITGGSCGAFRMNAGGTPIPNCGGVAGAISQYHQQPGANEWYSYSWPAEAQVSSTPIAAGTYSVSVTLGGGGAATCELECWTGVPLAAGSTSNLSPLLNLDTGTIATGTTSCTIN